MVAKGEFYFYEQVKDNCSVVFDIGCREDIHYVEMSEGKQIHLFEPNPKFYTVCVDKANKDTKNAVIVNNFGLGHKTQVIPYYEDSQSFIRRTVHYQSKPATTELVIKQFTKYLDQNDIKYIDFLKMDVEGFEPNILMEGQEFILENVKYVQFEYASTWLDRLDNFSLIDVINMFRTKFDFFFLLDEDHPISKDYPNEMTKIDSVSIVDLVNHYMNNQYGFNIAMVRKC